MSSPGATVGSGAPRKTGARPALSARAGVILALTLLAAMGLGQMLINLEAFASAAFMLKRAETSYRQLDAYQQLSIDLLEYLRLAGAPAPEVDSLADRRRSILSSIDGLDALGTFEVDLVASHGGRESNHAEDNRLQRIRAAVERVLSAPPWLSGGLYEGEVKPMLVEAVSGERAEVAGVEQSMSDLHKRMRWAGPTGVVLQLVTIAITILLIGRRVLNPLFGLVADIRMLGRGALAHRVEIKRHDEFGLLAGHINRMAGSLERGRRLLEDSHERLEGIVADRTQALRERNDELKEIDESRRRFFADVSHELRTPLTAITGEADVTLRIAARSIRPYRQALSSILANSTYLNRRIDDLMALSRSADGTLEVERMALDLHRVAADAMTEIESLARLNGVAVRCNSTAKSLPVIGDRTRLRQCLMILLDNAVKFSRDGDAIALILSRDDRNASLSIVDQGRGIAAEELPHVFERFYQTEIGRRMGGTGLGLAIARRIIEAHGGTIEVSRAEGDGTRATLTLPLDDEGLSP